jgi:putative DNA primase/helicase
MVSGCLRYQREGLSEPKIVLAATDEYRADSDTLGQWLEERCECSPEFEQRASDLWTSYKNWCEANEERTLGSKTFYQRMGERFTVRTSNGKRYEGVKLRPLGAA